jgi:hypothetical protein
MTATLDVVRPTAFTVPTVTKAVRDTLVAERGTFVYVSDLKQLSVATTGYTAGSTSWKMVA